MNTLIKWEHFVFSAKAGRPSEMREVSSGVLRIPAFRALPRRESYVGMIDASGWDSLTDALIQFWCKVAEMLPRFYAGENGVEPLSELDRMSSPEDNGWDRIVCLIDFANGKITSNLWNGSHQPKQVDRVWIIAKAPFMQQELHKVRDESFETEFAVLLDRVKLALTNAVASQPAQSAISSLQRWRKCSLWTMAEESPETLSKIGSLPEAFG